ncbi:MAG: sialidase family protein [Pyrinomonadaceae bacterium]
MKPLALAIISLIIFSGCRPATIGKGDVKPPIADSASQISRNGADTAEPAIAAAADGVYVAFVEHHPDRSADLFVQKLDAELKSVSGQTRVNSTTGEVRSWFGDPPTIAVSDDGAIYVGWNRKNDKGGGNDLMLSVSRDSGASFGAPVKVNDDTKPASHGMHSLQLGSDGRVYLAWLDERNVKTNEHAKAEPDARQSAVPGFYYVATHNNTKNETAEQKHEMTEPNSEVFFAASNDGGNTFSANKRISTDVCPCCKTSLALSPEGTLYLSWRQVLDGDLRHIAVASSTDSGKTFSLGVVVSDDQWHLNACPMSGAGLFAGEKGNLRIFWYTAGDAGQAGVYLAESADGAKTFGPRKLISGEGSAGSPWIGPNEYIFSVSGGKTSIRSNGKPDAAIDGELPAVALKNGKPLMTVVRTNGDERSIWLITTH